MIAIHLKTTLGDFLYRCRLCHVFSQQRPSLQFTSSRTTFAKPRIVFSFALSGDKLSSGLVYATPLIPRVHTIDVTYRIKHTVIALILYRNGGIAAAPFGQMSFMAIILF
ncbi:hypothetical protein O9993_03470 [Vibrio lentus]|nr:hypothetical protein [Vibrio lentus]